MDLQSIQWTAVCCTDLSGASYAEVQVRDGWLRLIKTRLGGYRVTVYGHDKRVVEPEREVSADECADIIGALGGVMAA